MRNAAMSRIWVLAILLLSAGCAGRGNVTVLTATKISEPKVVALQAPSAPWVLEIQRRLCERGFKVLRWSSTAKRSDVVDDGASTETYNKASARYVLVVNGHAPLDWANRPFGGGYKFSSISVDLVDVRNNETLMNVNGSGYSEGSPPCSGTIFEDITNAVDGMWAQ